MPRTGNGRWASLRRWAAGAPPAQAARPATLEDNIAVLLFSTEEAGREKAALSELFRTGRALTSTETLDALVQAVQHDKSPKVRAAAASALGFFGSGRVASVLARCSSRRHEKSEAVRHAAILSLAKFAPELLNKSSALSVMRASVGKEKNASILRIFISIFGMLRDRQSVPLLTQVLLYGEDLKLRVSAAESLGVIGDSSAIPALQQAYAESGARKMLLFREVIAKALEQIERQTAQAALTAQIGRTQ